MIYCAGLPDPLHAGKSESADTSNTIIYAKTSSTYHYPKHHTPYLFLANFKHFGTYRLNNRAISINDCSFYFLNAGDELEINFAKNVKLETLIILFNKNFVSEVYNYCMSSADDLLTNVGITNNCDLQLPGIPFVYSAYIRQCINKIITDRFADDTNPDEYYFDLLCKLLQCHNKSIEEISKLSAKKKSTREELYRRIIQARIFMEANLSSKVTIDDIAGEACLNKFHFLKLFKNCYGVTPYQYLLKLKMERSVELLRTGKFSVGEVCLMSGFESHGSFTNLFKKCYGFAPSHLPGYRIAESQKS
jgi:AraC family transcriptional regulator